MIDFNSYNTKRNGALGLNKKPISIIAEGDSWFNLPNFPLPVIPQTVIDYLAKDTNIYNIAHWGDTVEEIYNDRQWHLKLLQENDVKVFFLSAGGNDVIRKNLHQKLHQRKSADNDPSNAKTYLSKFFWADLEIVRDNIYYLACGIKRVSPGTEIYINSYDYAVPRFNGNILGSAFEFRGFSTIHKVELTRAVVKEMVDAFCVNISQLPDVKLLDVRKTLGSFHWWDELHPNHAGARKLVEHYRKCLPSVIT